MIKGNAGELKKKVIPVEENLFTMPSMTEGETRLIGSKCNFCGAVFFPKRAICGKCYRDGMEEVTLSRTGKVTTWTVIRMKSQGYKGEMPYVMGEVELPEGVVVRTQFRGIDPDNPAIKIGDSVEVMLEKIYEDNEGNDVVCYQFKPV